MVRLRIQHSGKVYHTVGGAAKMLRTNTAKVKQLMGDGSLEWLNLRVDGRLYITEESILAYQRTLLERKRALARAAKAASTVTGTERSEMDERPVLARDAFAKISEVEGIKLTKDMKRTLAEFDRQKLSPEARRRAIIGKFKRAGE
jgi:hypothetical protein